MTQITREEQYCPVLLSTIQTPIERDASYAIQERSHVFIEKSQKSLVQPNIFLFQTSNILLIKCFRCFLGSEYDKNVR